MSELVPLHETIESESVRLSSLLSSCRHAEYLHPSTLSSVDVMKRIVAKSSSTMSRASHGDASTGDLAILLELATQCRKIIDAVTVQIGKKHLPLRIR